MENIEIRLLTPADKDEITEFLEKNLASNGAPLMTNLRLPNHENSMIASSMVNSVLKDGQYCSYLAMDNVQKKVIGCVLQQIRPRWPDDYELQPNPDYSRGLQILLDFNEIMWSGASAFIPYPYSGPYLHWALALVDPKYRRLRLTKRMMAVSLDRAYNVFKCRYVIGFATSYKSQAYCESEGWITLRWINYNDYYVLGKRVFEFNDDPYQVCAKMMMLDIGDWLAK